MVVIKEPVEFNWDRWNIGKNKKKHDVGEKESEETFFDDKRVIYKDKFHSEKEDRFILLGQTRKKRLLYLAFTIRDEKIRIISARDINKKEVKFYKK